MSQVIPHFHFENPDKKLTDQWFQTAINHYWHSAGNKYLLEGKNLSEIEEYATGAIDMKPFLRMFKSYAKKIQQNQTGGQAQIQTNVTFDGVDNPLPLIPEKLNSAVALVQKIPVEIECRANDALAMQHKKEDLDFLMNKPDLEEDLQDFADQLGIGKVNLGGTKHSSTEFSDKPSGLDLKDPEQRDIFTKIIYSLRVEGSFEKALQQFYELKKAEQIRLLETIDQYWYGISTHCGYTSDITGLPDNDYVHPNEIRTQDSRLPDYGDNVARFRDKRMKVTDMINFFGSDICDETELFGIITSKKSGYCDCNNKKWDNDSWKNLEVEFVLCEIKTVDYVGVYRNPNSKRGFMTLTNDETKCTEKVWGQNTYQCWWLKNTGYFFKKDKLGYAYRTRGQESYQNFSTNIYRSQKKSAVELSIGENKVAQMAYMKLVYAIVMSVPAGKVIDIRGIRNAVAALVKEPGAPTSIDLITMAIERNVMLIDTEGYEGKDAQSKPFYEMPGGLKTEVQGYWQTIAQCAANISRFTGINDNLSGQKTEDLIGLQKLRIESSINAIHYVTEAIRSQYQSLFNIWANLIQYAIEKGGKTKQAIVNFIGIEDTNILDGLDEIPLHNLTIKISLTQREEERQDYRSQLNFLKSQGVISTTDEYLLSSITNPKERMRLLAIKENIWQKKQDQIRQEQQQNAMQQIQGKNEGLVAAKNTQVEGAVKQIYSKGEVDAKLMELASKLGIQASQLDFMGRRSLQQDRGQDQLHKAEKTIEKKQEVELQKPLAII